MQAAYCTSCGIQKDKSAYWTPQMYFRHRNGSYEEVPHDGTVVYYLGRGVDKANIIPFPKGMRFLAGDSSARSYDAKTLTTGNVRPIADRTSFACLDASGPQPETPGLNQTSCSSGLRAQIHFQSCWDGIHLYKSDQSHVAYLSDIDNGVCPPGYPYLMPHLFIEIIYSVNNIDKSDGGYFVFANGDTTGYGFHGDFLNGWDMDVLAAAVKNCLNTENGEISSCPDLAASLDPNFSQNCPEQPPLVNETVHGLLTALPGCNPPTGGPNRAASIICPISPNLNAIPNQDYIVRSMSKPGDMKGNWTYLGCAQDPGISLRPLTGDSYTDNMGLTIEKCTQYCHDNGYAYAGMEYATQCYCGNILQQPIQDINYCSTQSYLICSGNSLQFCGAPSLQMVWQDTKYSGPPLKGIPVPGVTTLSLPSGGTATYGGCYRDPSGAKALGGTTLVSYTDGTGMTLESCAAFCVGKGYSLFGAEYARGKLICNFLTSS